ncbi:MAG: glycosyltransferase family 9 protein [Acidobacteriaceae bacterium]|nr:glycosyltransferase family 9 protein [Acidobacteriaceae bacterium]
MNLRKLIFSFIRSTEILLRGRVNPSELDSIQEFLLFFYDPALGSSIHETPMLEALRAARPEARITVATFGLAAQALRNNPYIDRVLITPNPYTHTLAAARFLRREYRSGRAFCLITTRGSSRTRIAAVALILGGKALRIGFTQVPALYDVPLTAGGQESQININLSTLSPLGIHARDIEPRLFLSSSEINLARNLIGNPEKGTAVLVTRTSGGQPTRWPEDRFVEVAQYLIRKHGLCVLLTGMPSDVAVQQALAQRIGPGAESIAGKTTVAELAAVCSLADIAITLDTGGLHVARTQQLPLVVIAPAWQNSVEWMPLGRPWARILKGPWFPAPPPPNYAIEEVSVAEVIAAADDLLALYPPSAEARTTRVKHSLISTTP